MVLQAIAAPDVDAGRYRDACSTCTMPTGQGRVPRSPFVRLRAQGFDALYAPVAGVLIRFRSGRQARRPASVLLEYGPRALTYLNKAVRTNARIGNIDAFA
jgi:hypothetical protein